MLLKLFPWALMAAAAALEVAGDATIRTGLRTHRVLLVAIGLGALGLYGILVNLVTWDFSRLMGSYIAVFALVSVLTASWVFKENIPALTWAGLGLILCGGLAIQVAAIGR